jgi:2-methylcitrate dehydratase PrpD
LPQTTRLLAEFAADAELSESSSATGHVKKAILDVVGVTLRGSLEPAGEMALDYARSYSSSGPATIIGGGLRLAPALAAFVNGTAGHALDFDDIGLGAGHVTVAIAPAAIAVAESVGATGHDLCQAMVVGYEIASRLTRMYVDTRLGPYAAGYHKPSVYSVFGATAAAGRLLGLDRNRMQNALGMAASQTGGLRVNFGTMTKPMHAGVANRTGVEAAVLAARGFTASPDAIEGRFGWHDVICRGQGDLEVALKGLGDGYAIDDGLIYKLYPCCGANHYAIDAVLNLRRQCGFSVEDVDMVDVFIESRNLEEVLVYPWPRSGLEGKFSLAFNVAAALTDGEVTIDTFTDEAVSRLEAVRPRVRVHPVHDLPQNGARIAVHLSDGRVVEREQLVLRGSLEDPLAWADLVDKFAANADDIIGAVRREAVIDAVRNLDQLKGIGQLTEPLLSP